MCGIAGIFHYADNRAPVDREQLLRMSAVIAYRGPDDQGEFIDGPIGLANRRLAVVDVSAAGHQPMKMPDGSSCLTYNGECYNHQEFRSRLAAAGVRFRSKSDTETLLHILATYGPDALTDVAGIFAFAFWDARARRLILARDPLGVKQLYYHDDGRRVVFASEIKAVLQCAGVPREVDAEGVNEYLHFHTALFQRTLFKGISQVRAGEYIEVGTFGLRRKVYWETDGFQPRQESAEASVDQLRTLLHEVVGQQLMSDVPIGAFFSGGIDSCAVAAFAKRNGCEPRLFGVHFTNQDVIDERPYQEGAAKSLGLQLELTTVNGESFPDDFMQLSYIQDQPVIGPALIPMYHVSRLAASQVKVCLGGQAADEIFGGYARYALVHPGRVLASWMSGREPIQHDADGAGAAAVHGNLLKQLTDIRNLRRIVKLAPVRGWSERYFSNFAHVPERTWSSVIAEPAFVSRQSARETFEIGLSSSPALDPADKILHWDIQTYLAGLFQQDDRMSMVNSLESRVPLADPRVVRFALHTGFDLKFRAGATKWILRRAVADVIPAWVLNRRKVGFDTPAERWMRGPHRQFIRDLLLSKRAAERGWWNPRNVADLLNSPSAAFWFDVVWKLASLEAWAVNFLDQSAMADIRVEDAVKTA